MSEGRRVPRRDLPNPLKARSATSLMQSRLQSPDLLIGRYLTVNCHSEQMFGLLLEIVCVCVCVCVCMRVRKRCSCTRTQYGTETVDRDSLARVVLQLALG